MKQFLLVGVDISKKTLDLFFKPQDQHLKITNNTSGFKEFKSFIATLLSRQAELLVVMEHTGHYSLQWELYLTSLNIRYCKVPALHIKRSLGLTRGKTDKIDSRRIAQFGWRNREELTSDPDIDMVILKLREMISYRSKLVKEHTGLQCRLIEIKASGLLGPKDPFFVFQLQKAKEMNTWIKQVEKMISELIKSHEQLNKSKVLLTSIKSIGPVIAASMIAITNNFKRFPSARKFNCYAGLAPFLYESGSSIKGKTKVSHLANKYMKTILNLGASNAVQWNKELKAYYYKRIAEGKKRMAVLNIIRSKLVARMFAVIKRGSPYQELPLAA